MAEAKRVARDIPGWTDRLAREQSKAAARQGSFRGKVFEDLRPSEKDELLKAIAIQLKLIEPS